MTLRLNASQAHASPAPAPGWVRHTLPPEAGPCHSEQFGFGDGLQLVRSHYCPVRDLVEETTQQPHGRTLVITLGLQGESGFQADDGSVLRFGAGHTTLAAVRASRGERRFAAGRPVRQLRLRLDQEALDRYLGPAAALRLTETPGLRPLDFLPTSPAAAALARTLSLPPRNAPGAALDLHIAMLGLVAEQVRHLLPAPPAGAAGARASAAEAERLERARALMAEQLDRALSVDYLSAAVGLSATRLQQGFRHLFGTSPQRLLLELRMRRAWALLETGCQVAEAARRVGYGHPANFSAAFARFFGRTPKSVFGRRSPARRRG